MLCALHCAFLPFLFAFLPGLSIGLFGSALFESGFTVFASVVGVASLAWGWRRHRRAEAWQRLIPGLCLLWLGAFVPWAHDHTIIHALSMARSEEHTSELQSLMRISYAVFCLKKQTKKTNNHN